MPVTSASGALPPSSGHCGHLHVSVPFTYTNMDTHTIINKGNNQKHILQDCKVSGSKVLHSNILFS